MKIAKYNTSQIFSKNKKISTSAIINLQLLKVQIVKQTIIYFYPITFRDTTGFSTTQVLKIRFSLPTKPRPHDIIRCFEILVRIFMGMFTGQILPSISPTILGFSEVKPCMSTGMRFSSKMWWPAKSSGLRPNKTGSINGRKMSNGFSIKWKLHFYKSLCAQLQMIKTTTKDQL